MAKSKEAPQTKAQKDLIKRAGLANAEIQAVCYKHKVILRTRLNYTPEKVFASLEYIDAKKE